MEKKSVYKIIQDNGKVVVVTLYDCAAADYCFEKYGWLSVIIDNRKKPKLIRNALAPIKTNIKKEGN